MNKEAISVNTWMTLIFRPQPGHPKKYLVPNTKYYIFIS